MNYSIQPVSQDESIKSEKLIVNMGPQHPATHGVLRLEIETDSEIVTKAIPHIGYLHRCMEKHCESMDFRGVIPFVDRLDYLASMNMEHGYVLGIERMLGLEVPRRAEYIRVMVAELQRVASHLVAFGTYGIDLGAFTPFLYAFEQRERILSIFESISGGRLLYNYIWIGGVWHDMKSSDLDLIKNFVGEFDEQWERYDTLLSQNKIFKERTAHVGIVPQSLCHEYGATGPVLRGSGIKHDLRKDLPYSIYSELDFDIPVGEGKVGSVGDCWDRYYVRMREMQESVKIIQQCLDGIEDGEIMTKVPKVIKPPAGEIFVKTEAPKGEIGYHMIFDGKKSPYRLKVKSPCFTHVSMIPELAPGMMIADLVALIGSLDIVLGEVDR
jgi:NADH-quinone oxidoreductase subunit D